MTSLGIVDDRASRHAPAPRIIDGIVGVGSAGLAARGGGVLMRLQEDRVGRLLLRFRHRRIQCLERGRQVLQPIDMGLRVF